MKPTLFVIFLSALLAASSLIAQEKNKDNENKLVYGQKGIVELFGGLSLSGNSNDTSSISFSAEPGFNYFIIDNFYLGARLPVNVTKAKYVRRYLYLADTYYKTTVNLGLGIPLGFVFRIRDHAYFNLEAPAFDLYLYDMKHFVMYPNVVTSFKFPFDNAVADFGIRHNFFYISDKYVSDLYYSYNVFFGFSTCIDTMKKQRMAMSEGPGEKIGQSKKIVSPAVRRGTIAGAFFMSMLPICSGSWLAGWDWGGFAFSFLKTAGICSIVGSIFSHGTTPSWLAVFGAVTWPAMTLADMIYSPCMVAQRLTISPGDPAVTQGSSQLNHDGDGVSSPEVFVHAAPRPSEMRERRQKEQSRGIIGIDGANFMITHTL